MRLRSWLVGVGAFAVVAAVGGGIVVERPSAVDAASQYPSPSFYQTITGMLQGGSNILPAKCVADSDLTTCHLVVDAGSGFSGGSGSAGSIGAAGANGTTAQSIQGITGGVPVPVSGSFSATYPYNAASGQTATSGSFLGEALWNGGSVDAARGGPAGTAIANGTAGVEYVQGIGTAGAVPVSGAFYQATQPVSIATTVPVSAATTLPIQLQNGANVATVDANGVQTAKVCDSTTSTQCAKVDANGVSRVLVCNAASSTVCINATSPATGQASSTGLNTWSQNAGYNGTTWDPMRKDSFSAGPLWVTSGGNQNGSIAAATTGPTVIKASAGRIGSFLIVTAGTTGNETFYDNASACSGTVIAIAAGASVDSTRVAGADIRVDRPAVNGITACGGAASPGVTVTYY